VDGVAVPAATMSAHVDTVVAGTNTTQSLAEVYEEAVGGPAVPELRLRPTSRAAAWGPRPFPAWYACGFRDII
jgi:hypothetical protein